MQSHNLFLIKHLQQYCHNIEIIRRYNVSPVVVMILQRGTTFVTSGSLPLAAILYTAWHYNLPPHWPWIDNSKTCYPCYKLRKSSLTCNQLKIYDPKKSKKMVCNGIQHNAPEHTHINNRGYELFIFVDSKSNHGLRVDRKGYFQRF